MPTASNGTSLRQPTARLTCIAPPSTLGSSRSAFLRAANASSACSIVRRRDHRHEMAAMIVASRKRPASAMAAVRGLYRSASQMNAISRTKPAVSTPNTTASSAQTKRPELKPILACACSSRYRRQPPIQRFPRLLACPDGPEQKAKRQGQRQSRVGPLLQRLVDRNGHVVADLADRLDCFPSLVLGVRDDTSDIRTCRHGSILSYAIVCCKTKCGHKSSAFGSCVLMRRKPQGNGCDVSVLSTLPLQGGSVRHRLKDLSVPAFSPLARSAHTLSAPPPCHRRARDGER